MDASNIFVPIFQSLTLINSFRILPTTSKLREKVKQNFFGISDEFKDRNRLITSFGEQKRAETIEKYLKREEIAEAKGMIGDGGSGV